MSPTLRNSLLKLRTEKLDALQLKQVQLESYEYLEAEGLLDKAPDVKSLLAAVRKSLSQNNSIDAAAIEKEEAFSSHEGIFMSTSLRDVMLEKFEGLDDEARRTIGSWDSWDSCFAAVADAGWVLDLSTKVADSSSPQWSLAPKKSTEEITHVMEKRWPSTSAIQTFENKSSYLETCQLDPQTYSVVATRFQENVQEIHRHLKAGNYDAARELLEDAFEEEFDYGQSDQGRRSALLFFSSIVS
ncbi:MAG: hypothetical protein L6R37_008217, partial [Teloschistes peruensis]